MMYVFWQIPLP